MQMSAIMESGMVRLNARVPIREDVRKQPLRTQRLVTKNHHFSESYTLFKQLLVAFMVV